MRWKSTSCSSFGSLRPAVSEVQWPGFPHSTGLHGKGGEGGEGGEGGGSGEGGGEGGEGGGMGGDGGGDGRFRNSRSPAPPIRKRFGVST